MLVFQLLPYFLVVRVSDNVDSWLKGVEYTYLVGVNMLAVDDDGALGRRAYDIHTNLKCRPRAPETLSCRFERTREDYSEIKESVSEFDVSELPFEVEFNRFGIQQLRVDKSLRPWEIDMIRAIINQLNFGYDVMLSPDVSPVREVSYLGKSWAWVVVKRQTTKERSQSSMDVNFQITPQSRDGMLREVIDIEKTRIIEKPPHLAGYFFGSKEAYRDPPEDLVATMKSSVSRIIISNTNFTSYTVNEILVNRDRTKNITLREKISLTLRSVAPAKTELQPIRNARRASFFVHKYVGDESSEEN